jgi:iron(III) transport system ATP-binding protein
MGEIRIEGLTKRYGAETEMAAVDGLSLDIGENQFITLLGPSGCGKSTTLRLIAGYIVPDAGTIRLGGRIVSEPGRVTPPEERGMGMVFQNYAVWPHKTVFENVVFGLRVKRVPREEAIQRVRRILSMVHLEGLEDRYPSQLSGGQQQRTALARSLVVEPAVLLLDEPLSNLDAKLRERMRSELKALQRRTGITFIYVTHDQAEALALSDRIAVMHGGRLQQYGAPKEIYERPANRVVADFLGLVNMVPASVVGIDAGGASLALGPLRLRFPPNPDFKVDGVVEVVIRPESIRFVPAGTPGAVGAEIEELSYLGGVSDYALRLEGGLRLRARVPAGSDHPAEGAVAIAVDASQCSVFPLERLGA